MDGNCVVGALIHYEGSLSLIKNFIKRGARWDRVFEDGVNFSDIAYRLGQTDILLLFLRKGLVPSEVSSGVLQFCRISGILPDATEALCDILWEAVEEGDLYRIQDIVRLGTPVDYATKHGLTPLYWAVKENSKLDVIKALVSGGANVNHLDESSRTPMLVFPIMRHQTHKIVQLLVENGADLALEVGDTNQNLIEFCEEFAVSPRVAECIEVSGTC